MKKFISVFLAVLLVLSLCACGGANKAPKGLSVGFGRADITPTMRVGLHGYGDVEERQSQGVFNRLYATCIAITGESGETVLMYTVDLILVNSDMTQMFRPAVSEATGVPESNITASATHTHSGPSHKTNATYWSEIFAPKMVEAAQAAMADRAKTTVQTGSTHTEYMNFVRHYVTDQGKVIGDNFGSTKTDGARVKHTTEVDNEIQILRFIREDKQDILMVNYQGHPKTASTGDTATGRGMRNMIASDYIGTTREYLEGKDSDLLFAFYLGASGNVNVFSNIKEEQAKNTENPKEFGQRLGDKILEALPSLTDQGQPDVKCTRQKIAVNQKTGTEGFPLELTAVHFGNIGFVAAPFEMFDTQGMFIKDESPCETTFVMTCASGHMGYIPSDYAWDYTNCYEVRATSYARGTAETFAQAAVDALKAMN